VDEGRGKPKLAFEQETEFDAECPRCSAKLVLNMANHVETLVQQPGLKRIEGETFFDPKIGAQVELTQDMKDTTSAMLAQLNKLIRLLEPEQVLPGHHRHIKTE